MDEAYYEITARTVTIEVTDERTGQTFRRELPLDYYENANCLRLQGEDLEGKPSQIVFYSARGTDRLKDLTGRGADHDLCGTHEQPDHI